MSAINVENQWKSTFLVSIQENKHGCWMEYIKYLTHMWCNGSYYIRYLYICYTNSEVFMIQVHGYDKEIGDITCSGVKESNESQMRYLHTYTYRFDKIAKSLSIASKKRFSIFSKYLETCFFKWKNFFTENFDENQGGLCFDNCVYDLNEMVYLDTRHENMFPIPRGYDFCSEPNWR